MHSPFPSALLELLSKARLGLGHSQGHAAALNRSPQEPIAAVGLLICGIIRHARVLIGVASKADGALHGGRVARRATVSVGPDQGDSAGRTVGVDPTACIAVVGAAAVCTDQSGRQGEEGRGEDAGELHDCCEAQSVSFSLAVLLLKLR